MAASFLILAPLPAREIEGFEIASQVSISGKTLSLNGAGVRTVTLLILPVKAYVAAFYTPSPLRSEKAVVASPGPLVFTFTFLQGVSADQVRQAWRAQLDTSVTKTYPTFTTDRDVFASSFGPMKRGGMHTVEIEGQETRVFDGSKLIATISGRNFQAAFSGMWFGSNPVQESLKQALLGN